MRNDRRTTWVLALSIAGAIGSPWASAEVGEGWLATGEESSAKAPRESGPPGPSGDLIVVEAHVDRSVFLTSGPGVVRACFANTNRFADPFKQLHPDDQFVFDVAIFMVGLSASEMSANWAQWWWWRFNGWGRVAASFGGGLVYVAMRLIWPEMTWWNRMFAAMGISTALWIIVSLATAPERREVLEAFYRRARPLGFWGPVAGSVAVMPIARGLLVALAGAAAVMAYIVGLSRAYVGDFLGAGFLGSSVIGLAAVFWRAFSPYVRSLLSEEETAHLDRSEAEAVSAAQTFGLSGLAAVVAAAIAVVLVVNGSAASVRSVQSASIGTALALGLLARWLWRKHRVQEGDERHD